MFLKYISPVLNFLQGTYAKFGTTSNLFREVIVSVMAAVAVALTVQLLLPTAPSPIAEVRDLINPILKAQHRADSVLGLQREWVLRERIDSLIFVLHDRDLQDSLRATAGLSPLDAMRRINGASANTRLEKRRGIE
ncbi:hypothetical protein [uncultured Fibrella sp.]|uniref:hypothetical protein n=1 Tax=uncultured Fibrella sp. TaxID=1284596 RepID=UPI0035CC457D